MSTETVVDVQAEVADLIKHAESVIENLRDAECCETGGDLRENLAAAFSELHDLGREVKALWKRANVATEEVAS